MPNYRITAEFEVFSFDNFSDPVRGQSSVIFFFTISKTARRLDCQLLYIKEKERSKAAFGVFAFANFFLGERIPQCLFSLNYDCSRVLNFIFLKKKNRVVKGSKFLFLLHYRMGEETDTF